MCQWELVTGSPRRRLLGAVGCLSGMLGILVSKRLMRTVVCFLESEVETDFKDNTQGLRIFPVDQGLQTQMPTRASEVILNE